MNKYQEALEFLIDKADDLCQSLTSKIMVSKKADVLQELIDKVKKFNENSSISFDYLCENGLNTFCGIPIEKAIVIVENYKNLIQELDDE